MLVKNILYDQINHSVVLSGRLMEARWVLLLVTAELFNNLYTKFDGYYKPYSVKHPTITKPTYNSD